MGITDFGGDFGDALRFDSDGIVLDKLRYPLNGEGYRPLNNRLLKQYFKGRPVFPTQKQMTREITWLFTCPEDRGKRTAKRFMLVFDQNNSDGNTRSLRRVGQGIAARQILVVNRSFLHRLYKKKHAALRGDLGMSKRWCILENPEKDLVYLIPRRKKSFRGEELSAVFIAGHGSPAKLSPCGMYLEPHLATLTARQFRLLLLHLDRSRIQAVSCTTCGSGKTSLLQVINHRRPLRSRFSLIVHSMTDLKTCFSLYIDLKRYFELLEKALVSGRRRSFKAFGKLCTIPGALYEEPVLWRGGQEPVLINPLNRLRVARGCYETGVATSRPALCLYDRYVRGNIVLLSEKRYIPRLHSMIPGQVAHVIRRVVYPGVSIVKALQVGISSPRLKRSTGNRELSPYPYRRVFPFLQLFYLNVLECCDASWHNVMIVPPYRNVFQRTIQGNYCIYRDHFGWRIFEPIIPVEGGDEMKNRFLSEEEALAAIYNMFLLVRNELDLNRFKELFWGERVPHLASRAEMYLGEGATPHFETIPERQYRFWAYLSLKNKDYSFFKKLSQNIKK